MCECPPHAVMQDCSPEEVNTTQEISKFFVSLSHSTNTKGNTKLIKDSGEKAYSKLLILLFLNVLFVTCSAYAFCTIENKYSLSVFKDRQNRSDDLKFFMNKYYNDNITKGNYPYLVLTDSEWQQLKELHRTRCFKVNNIQSQNNLWNFWTSLDFCSTILTTIGYGNMSPKTVSGRIITIFYSFLGIPLMALYLAIFSKFIYKLSSVCIQKTLCLVNRVVCPLFGGSKNTGMTCVQFKAISLTFLSIVLVCYVVGLSFQLQYSSTRDTLVRCVYFYVITLTTTGIGDISMTEHNALVLVRMLFVFCIGLTLVTTVFNAVRSLLLANRKALKRAKHNLKSVSLFVASYKNVRKLSDVIRKWSRITTDSQEDTGRGSAQERVRENKTLHNSASLSEENDFITPLETT